MQEQRRTRRDGEILDAAFRILETRGARGMSMLTVARAAKASNETLYRWYGDKLGLLAAMARREGADLRRLLEKARPEPEASALEVLDVLGPRLLGALMADRTAALARAAAGDETGRLSRVLGDEWRNGPLAAISQLCESALAGGALRGGDATTIRETYLSLLVGDWPTRRTLLGMPKPTEGEIRSRADRALMLTWRLFGRETG